MIMTAQTRAMSADGEWTVETVELSATGTGHDGEWLRIRRRGYYTADVRPVTDLATHVETPELSEAVKAALRAEVLLIRARNDVRRRAEARDEAFGRVPEEERSAFLEGRAAVRLELAEE
jgi:hypothetical protein